MANLEKGVTVRAGRCHGCGHPVPFVTMKNGKLWYGCTYPDEKGVSCGTRHFFGHAESQKFIAEYLEHRKAANDAKRAAALTAKTQQQEIEENETGRDTELAGRPERPEPDAGTANDNREPEPKRGSFYEQFG